MSAEGAAGAEPDAEVSFFARDLNMVVAAGKDRGGRVPRRGAHPRARRCQLGRQFRSENRGSDDECDAGDAHGLCARAPRRSLCRFRAPHRTRERHPASRNHRAGDRRQCLQRRAIVLKKGDSVRDPARDGRDGGQGQGDNGRVRRTQRTAVPRTATSCACCWRPEAMSSGYRPVHVIIATKPPSRRIVAWSEIGKYVAVDVRSANSVACRDNDDEDDGEGVRLYQSIYGTGVRDRVPRP